jgi:hypothetical protein
MFATLLAAHAFAAGSKPQVVYFQQKVSVDAESIPLSRLLRLWDEATGMRSNVPPELSTQTVTVKFWELPLDEAVRRIFEKLPLDYVFIEAQGIIVTGRSQAPAAPAAAETPPVYQGAPAVANPLPQGRPNAPAMKPPPPAAPLPDSGENPVLELPPALGAAPPLPFFAPAPPPPPVAPVFTQNDLFRPLPIYQAPSAPSASPPGP